MKNLLLAASLLLPLALHAQPPLVLHKEQPAKAPKRPLVVLYDAAGVTKACDGALAAARKTVAAMEAR